jgi:proline dehydrogenase
LQANLKRTLADLESLAADGGRIRLVKGAYREPATIAHRRRADVDRNMLRLIDLLFDHGDHFAIASHDSRMVDRAVQRAKGGGKAFEFQFLLGVREPMKRDLVSQGHRAMEYVPYGPNWLAYFTRRVRERPRNILTAIQSIIQG